ncbi:MAG: hypothetical protein AB9903_18295 [Vulcanimicrobiota bacterium]
MPRIPIWDWITSRKTAYETFSFAVKKRLFSCRTAFQEVVIVDTFSFGKMLFLDGAIQSSEYDEFIYHEALVHPALITHGSPGKVLIIGGGEGATLREVLRHRSVKEVVMVDIDEELVGLCRKHLPSWSAGSFDDSRVSVIFADGMNYLTDSDCLFDIIISDLPEPEPSSISSPLFTGNFFTSVKSHLAPGGIFCSHSAPAGLKDMNIFREVYRTMKGIFPQVNPMKVFVPSFGTESGFLCASVDGAEPDMMTGRTVLKRIRSQIAAGKTEKSLQFYNVDMHSALFTHPVCFWEALCKGGIR